MPVTGSTVDTWEWGNSLLDLLESKGMTRMDFQKAMGVTHTAVTYWVNGYRTPNIANLSYMATLFTAEEFHKLFLKR